MKSSIKRKSIKEKEIHIIKDQTIIKLSMKKKKYILPTLSLLVGFVREQRR